MLRRTGRYYAAWAALGITFLLHWNVWMEGEVHPVILGMPILVLYHVGYVFLCIATLWFFFSTIWPETPEDY